MKKRLLLWNLLLAACATAGVLELRREWMETQAKQNLVLAPRKLAPPKIEVAAPQAKPNPFQAISFAEIAQKTLFAKDRNPNVAIEQPKAPPPPPPPMPPLPRMFGVLGLPSGAVAIMTDKVGGEQKKVRQGENIGEFKVAKLDTQRITLVWKDKTVEKTVDELLDRTPAAAAAAPQAMPAYGGAPGNAAPKPGEAPVDPKLGVAIGDGIRACRGDDSSPVGTEVDGYKKVTEATPFGTACRWLQAK
jgi:hypothetical protein